jgi:polynucleotide 5'-kinase involved in rRNA processing
MLRSIDQIQEAAKDHKNAILIFGAHMSGKTTFRHYLAGDELEYV